MRSWKSILLGSALIPLSAAATTAEIATDWLPYAENQFSFFIGDHEVCSLKGQAPPNENASGRCQFKLPEGTKTLTIKGRYTDTVWDAEADRAIPTTVEGETTVPLRDGSTLTAALRDTALPLAERWRRTAQAEHAFAESIGGNSIVKLGEPATKKMLAAAEKRLGFALPADYRNLMLQVGPIAFGDNTAAAPEHLVTLHDTLAEWGYGPEGEGDAKKRLLRSTALFFETGDGMGAEVFLAPPTPSCGKQPAFVWFQEEDLTSSLEQLMHGKPRCTKFIVTLAELFERYVVAEHESFLRDERGELLVDFGAPQQTFHLNYAIGEGRFQVYLSRE